MGEIWLTTNQAYDDREAGQGDNGKRSESPIPVTRPAEAFNFWRKNKENLILPLKKNKENLFLPLKKNKENIILPLKKNEENLFLPLKKKQGKYYLTVQTGQG